jgi:hypothetical protein
MKLKLTIVFLFKAGTPPSKTKTGLILKKRSLQILLKKPMRWLLRRA